MDRSVIPSSMATEIPRPDKTETPAAFVQSWKEMRKEVMEILSSIQERDFHSAADRGWNAAEIAEHLYKTQWNLARMIPVILSGKIGLDKDHVQKVDYSKTYEHIAKAKGHKNPESVAPSNTLSKEETISSLDKAMEKLEKNLTGVEMDALRARGVDHPLLGPLSLADWLWALILHEQAHLIVMKEKYKKTA